jgi:high-affinity Fe2+/Pb2+ permease
LLCIAHNFAKLAGSFPVAVLYAVTGATAANWNNSILAFGLVLLMAGLFWIAGHRFRGTLFNKLDWQKARRGETD